MSKAIRQENLYGAEDWSLVYSSFKNAEFVSYDFDTLRESMIKYMQINYPEEFNDYIQNSEFIALLDLVAYVGQNLAFRMDLNARENILDTAEKRESVLRIARMLSYKPKRVRPAQGFFKVTSVSTTDQILDSTGLNLSGKTIQWGSDPSELEYERFIRVMNAAFNNLNKFGTPVKRNVNTASGNIFEIYEFNNTNLVVNYPVNADVAGTNLNFDLLPIDISSDGFITQSEPDFEKPFSLLYRNDGRGVGSSKTGFFFLAKQGFIGSTTEYIVNPISNAVINLTQTQTISEEDFFVQTVDESGAVIKTWTRVSNLDFSNIVLNEYSGSTKDIYEVIYSDNDVTSIKFGDGTFTNIPTGYIRVWYRNAENDFVRVKSGEISEVAFEIEYTNEENLTQTLTLTLSLQDNMITGLPAESLDEIKLNAPEAFYSKNRMVTGDDYNGFLPTLNSDVLIMKAENRTFSGHTRHVDLKDPTGKSRPLIEFADDGYIYGNEYAKNFYIADDNTRRTVDLLDEFIESKLSDIGLLNFYYGKLDLNGAGNTTLFPLIELRKTDYYTTLTQAIPATGTVSTINVQSINTDNSFDNFNVDGGLIQIENELFTYTGVVAPRRGYIFARTSGSAILTGTNTNNLAVGMYVQGTGIPAGARIVSIIDNTSITLDAVATSTAASAEVLFNTVNDFVTRFTGVARAQQGTAAAAHATSVRVFKCLDYRWRKVYSDTTSSNGYISESSSNDNPVKLGYTTNSILRAVRPGSFIKLVNNSGVYTWVSIKDIKGDGLGIEDANFEYTGVLSNGMGPVEISEPITDVQLVKSIIPAFPRIFDDATRSVLLEKLSDRQDFALKFNNVTSRWTILPSTVVVDLKSNYNTNNDSTGWLINVAREGISGWTLTIRQFDYVFGSEELLRFYNINYSSSFNPNIKLLSQDKISILGLDSNSDIVEKMLYRISGYYVYDDGYTDSSKVKVTPLDLDNDFLPDDPEHFVKIVGSQTLRLTEYEEGNFSYIVPAEVNTPAEDIVDTVPGKKKLPFKWHHKVDIDQTLNPSLTNIIDVYVLTKTYNDEYMIWKRKNNSSIKAPLPPTTEELRASFGSLASYKMMTDEVIFHPVRFKPLFGTLATPEFQAQFKVVKNPKTKLTDSEIKSKVIAAVDKFFTPGNFGFGEIFYFTELAAYIHSSLSTDLNSVVIVPISADGRFGTLFQIQPDKNEVVTSVAGVNDVIVINEITDSNIRISK